MLSETANEKTVVERKVKPVGRLLNDNDSGVDQLGYLVYAQALSKLLHTCNPPISIGIFGPWGIGKTFLLKHVQCLLRKYEQQEKYDAGVALHGSSNNYIEEDGPRLYSNSENSSSKQKPRNRTRAVNLRRACLSHCAVVISFLMFVAVCAALLVIVFCFNPTDETNEAEITNRTSMRNASGAASYVTTTSTDITFSSGERIYLIIFLVTFTGMVFGVFCCCIANTDSKCWTRFRSNYMLTLYAAFTRLPTITVTDSTELFEPSNAYVITHFDDERAILSHDSGDEEYLRGVHISSTEVRKLPKKYVFVNYHAWQYAGSDTLWAGIVTKLSDAIEKEFGTVCVRIFRMLQVESPSKSGPIKIGFMDSEDPRCLYVRFKFPQNRQWTLASRHERVLFVVKEFGVVTECFNYRDSIWYVRYATDKEADYAEAALKLDSFEVHRKRPNVTKVSPNESSSSLQQTSFIETQTTSIVQEITPEGLVPMTILHPRDSEQLKSGTPLIRKESVDMRDTSSLCCSGDRCRFLTHFRRHPKTVCCGCPFLYCCFFFVAAALIFPITLLVLVNHFGLQIMESSKVIPVEVQILSWMPATFGVLLIVLRFCWAMCHSQTDRIRKYLAGSRGNMKTALGFMNDVKQEVMIMSKLINCVRFTHGIDYKIVLTIDDLDRCPYDKVKSVLEAVNILLSDRSSPFLCLIAVDSRVAAKCIEQDMGGVLLQANLTGHEYLKKIINLPFCLPEVSINAKRKYFGGVMDSADVTKLVTTQPERNNEPCRSRLDSGLDSGDQRSAHVEDHTQTDCALSPPRKLTSVDSGTSTDGGRPKHALTLHETRGRGPKSETMFKDYSDFRFHCRKILNGDGEVGGFIHEYLCGNPRNMKRIFNVLSLTTHLMECIEERRERVKFLSGHREGFHRLSRTDNTRRTSIMNSDVTPKKQCTDFGRSPKDAEDLIKWIVAADQWPYRISYILQVVEDLDNRSMAGVSEDVIEETCTLFEIYEKHVEPEIEASSADISMLTLDNDPAALRGFLRRSKSLTRRRISSMFHITVNLDQSLRNGISRQRAMLKVTTSSTPDSTDTI